MTTCHVQNVLALYETINQSEACFNSHSSESEPSIEFSESEPSTSKDSHCELETKTRPLNGVGPINLADMKCPKCSRHYVQIHHLAKHLLNQHQVNLCKSCLHFLGENMEYRCYNAQEVYHDKKR